MKAVHTEFLKATLLLLVSFLLVCCHSRKEHPLDKNIQELFFDYQISGTEEKQDITFILKFCLGLRQGKGMGIYRGKVLIDGVQIVPDSSLNDGIYYETTIAKKKFSLSHFIEVQTSSSEKYIETIDFNPFSLEEEIPARLKRNPFYVKLKGYKSGSALRLVLQDSSRNSIGINEIVKVHQGSLLVNQFMIDRLITGPVLLKIYEDQEKALKNTMKPGGMLHILYSLERDFNLED
ncbi:MAG: hypothetical protein NVS1B13_12680 [Flavisolibacter sp.]